ncbi:chondroitin AC/alginate lyase [Cucurbitaria berberidis CBS 394.84]|uniref:Chondroitin AC/alginate lyase n=1 Tax=Cucurbitaria berberidis CBS 394.84 TaxID=1168544 RepID=A0A9P4L3S0_9PLEO|nr:chondroitin AC/alginate lyase [Cucurbitaria berberidis CBS 394.84]KAF1840068.1 chondroitin AC/alginate lyase [Cucurbitaria berberidis CBS 394.84]
MSSILSTCINLLLLLSSAYAFNHPGLLVSEADITRIQNKLSAHADPWQASWDKLVSLDNSQSTYVNHAVAGVYRNTANGVKANAELLWHDAAAAFNLALRWKIERNATYAEAASNILGAWGRKLKEFDVGDDEYLTAGLQGYQLVNAAELLRDHAPFESSGNATAFSTMFEKTFLYKNLFFLNHKAPSEHNVRHFFANWELCNMASAMAFGIYTDNATLFDFAVEYFKTGEGNGAVNNGISNLVSEPGTGTIMGQPQEAGRDQGHTGLDFQLFGVVAQQAWNQGKDLYGYNSSRVLLGAEYYARYNLGNDVPFEPYTNGIVSYTTVSPASRGAHRPTWELLYAHYVQIKGLEAPWTELYKNYTTKAMGGFEGGAGSWGEGSGHYDGLGWGSLLHHLDVGDVDAVSSNSSASNSATLSTPSTTSSNKSLVAQTSAYVTTSVPASATTSVLPRSSKSSQKSTVSASTTLQSVLEAKPLPTRVSHMCTRS